MSSNPSDMENDDSNVFCVPAGIARKQYFLDTDALNQLEHKVLAGRCYGGNFKFFKPIDLENAAIKLHGEAGLQVKRRQREEQWRRKQEREAKAHAEWEANRAYEERQSAIPKRPRTAWHYFQQEMRDVIKAEHADKSPQERIKILSSSYKSLTKDERKVYDNKAVQDKARFEQQKKQFEAKYGKYTGY